MHDRDMSEEGDNWFFEEPYSEDEYFDECTPCKVKGCIMPGAHFSSDCMTAEDAENYYSHMEGYW